MEFEGYHSVMLDRCQNRIEGADLGYGGRYPRSCHSIASFHYLYYMYSISTHLSTINLASLLIACSQLNTSLPPFPSFLFFIHMLDTLVSSTAGLWEVVRGTTIMQCELAGDMHSSLAMLLGAVSANSEHDAVRIKGLVCIYL